MQKNEWRLQTRVYVYLRKALDRNCSTVWGVDFPKVTNIGRIMMHQRGVRGGVADLHVMSNGIYVALELKSDRYDHGSDLQKAFGQAMFRSGGHWFIVRSCEEVVNALQSVGIGLDPLVAIPGDESGAVVSAPKKKAPSKPRIDKDAAGIAAQHKAWAGISERIRADNLAYKRGLRGEG
jgi:hypothetical protein